MSASPIRVLIVDDYEPFRRFLLLSLQIRMDVQIVSAVSDGLEAVSQATELQPDLILLDIGLPKLNGIAAARKIHETAQKSKILFVSQQTSAAVVQAALDTGAHGFLVKTDAASELLTAIDTVMNGRRFVSSTVAELVQDRRARCGVAS